MIEGVFKVQKTPRGSQPETAAENGIYSRPEQYKMRRGIIYNGSRPNDLLRTGLYGASAFTVHVFDTHIKTVETERNTAATSLNRRDGSHNGIV